MPKRTNVKKTNGGADIEELNELHNQLVQACKAALDNEIASGEIKAATLNTIRQVCADAGVNPSRTATSAMDEIVSVIPTLNLQEIASQYNR